MTMNTFTFRNEMTGEIKSATSISLNNAARAIHLDVPFRGKLPEPWKAIECRHGNEILWTEEQIK